jgi:serine/threonine-protein kinase
VDQLERLKSALADRYRIERELGAGGMATVYLAEDLKHKRKVALKVLKPELAAVLGAERFVQEITTTASLQHPHILALFDSGEAGGFLYYVMPFIEGETLRDKLDREKQLGIEEAVRITTEVADALDYAHRNAVIHRDIKPENILLHDGRPMVADFGIALAVSAAAGGRMTETGLSLGTPHYMSPEQATAEKDLTNRSDIYSLGAVLYEMLTGSPPHVGSSAQQIIMKIVTDEARPVTELRKSVPSNVAAATAKALEKLPVDRFERACKFAEALIDPTFAIPTTTTEAASIATRRWKWLSAALGSIAVALSFMIVWGPRRTAELRSPARYDVGLPDSARMRMNYFPGFAVSPAGDFVVYVAEREGSTELWYHSLWDDATRPIAGTDGATNPTISPLGDRVAFYSGGELKTVPVMGGSVSRIARVEVPADAVAPRWMTATQLLVPDGNGTRLRWLDPETGTEEVTPVDTCHLPYPISDDRILCSQAGEQYAIVRRLDDGSETWLRALSSDTDTSVSILRGGHFRLVDGEYLVYLSIEGEIRAVRWDTSTSLVGRPVTLVPGVRREPYTGVGQWDLSATGTLVYAGGANAQVGQLVRRYDADPPEPLPIEPAAFRRLDLSRDGRWLAAVVQGIREQELRIYDLKSLRVQRWLRGFQFSNLLWTPSNDSLIVLATRVDGASVTLIGSPTAPTPPDTLFHGTFVPRSFISDDIVLGYDGNGLSMTLRRSVAPVQVDTFLNRATQFPALSSDNRWLIFAPSGSAQLLLTRYPEKDRQFELTPNGFQPRWLTKREIVFYRCCWDVYRSQVDETQAVPTIEPRLWFSDPRFTDLEQQAYAVTPDGGLIYMQTPPERLAPYLRVIPDWVEQMKRAVDEANR